MPFKRKFVHLEGICDLHSLNAVHIDDKMVILPVSFGKVSSVNDQT